MAKKSFLERAEEIEQRTRRTTTATTSGSGSSRSGGADYATDPQREAEEFRQRLIETAAKRNSTQTETSRTAALSEERKREEENREQLDRILSGDYQPKATQRKNQEKRRDVETPVTSSKVGQRKSAPEPKKESSTQTKSQEKRRSTTAAAETTAPVQARSTEKRRTDAAGNIPESRTKAQEKRRDVETPMTSYTAASRAASDSGRTSELETRTKAQEKRRSTGAQEERRSTGVRRLGEVEAPEYDPTRYDREHYDSSKGMGFTSHYTEEYGRRLRSRMGELDQKLQNALDDARINGTSNPRDLYDSWRDERRSLQEQYERWERGMYSAAQQRAISELTPEELTILDRYYNTQFEVSASGGIQYVADPRGTQQQLEEDRQALLDLFGRERMNSLLEYRGRQLDAQRQAEQSARLQAGVENNGVLGAMAGSAYRVLTNAVAGPMAAVDIVRQGFGPNPHAPLNTSSPGFAAQNATQALQGAVSNMILGDDENPSLGRKVLNTVYQTGMSAADSVTAMLIGGESGGLLLGINAATSAAQDITERGGSYEQALTGGIASGYFEMLFEELSIGNYYKLKETPNVTGWRDFFGNVVKSMGVNASEELATDTANFLYDWAVNGDISEMSIRIRELKEGGLTEEQARRQYAKELGLQFVNTGGSGALMGLFFGATGSAQSYYRGNGIRQQARPQQNTPTVQQEQAGPKQIGEPQLTVPAEDAALFGQDTQRPAPAAEQEAQTVQSAAAQVQQSAAEVQQAAETVRAAAQSAQAAAQNAQVQNMQAAAQMDEGQQTRTPAVDVIHDERLRTVLQNFANQEASAEPQLTVPAEDAALFQEEPQRAGVPAENTAPVADQRQQSASDESRLIAADFIRDARQYAPDDPARQTAYLQNVVRDFRNVDARTSEQTGIDYAGVADAIEELIAQEYTENTRAGASMPMTDGGAADGRGEDVLLPRGGERDDRTGAGGQGRAVAGVPGSDQTRQADRGRSQVQTAIDRQNRVNAQGTRVQRVSTLDQGFRKGTNAKRNAIFSEDLYDERMTATRDHVRRETGMDVIYVSGRMEFEGEDGKTFYADAAVANGKVYINATSARNSIEQLAEHEIFHDKRRNNPGLFEDVRTRLESETDPAEYQSMVAAYAEAYGGVYNVQSADEASDLVVEEIAADAYAGMNKFGSTAARYSDIVRSTVDSRTRAGRFGANTTQESTAYFRGDPGRAEGDAAAAGLSVPAEDAALFEESGGRESRYSIAGERSRTADLDAETEAQRMEADGYSAEDIFRETGWFRGADGQWRYELDDSAMRFYQNADAQFRRDHPEYARMTGLYDKLLDGSISVEEYSELQDLDRTWGQETRRLAGRLENGSVPLRDVIDHPILFEAYPELQDIRVRYADLSAAEQGGYNPNTNTITLANGLTQEEATETILHEIQHAVQRAEGHARGSNPTYWLRRSLSDRITVKDMEQQARDLWESIHDLEESSGYNAYADEMAQLEDSGSITEDQYFEAVDAWLAENAPELNEMYDRYWDMVDQAYKLEQRAERTPMDLYKNTYGEREARDTTARRTMNQEQRMSEMPFAGDERSVYVDDTTAFLDSEIAIQNQIRPIYTDGTHAFDEFVDSLSPEARATFDLFYNFYQGSRLTNTTNAQGKHVKKINISSPYLTAQQWNEKILNDEKWHNAAVQLAASLPENIRENMRFNTDGTITPSPLEEKLKMARSLAQRLVDALPLEPIDSTYVLGGKTIEFYDQRSRQSVGGEAYRRVLTGETRKAYTEGTLRQVSIASMTKDGWGSMGFLATNGKTGASGDLTTLCPQMMYNLGCFYCYRRNAMETGVNNKLVAESVWYTGEILRMKQEDIERLNRNGGLRIQSFGDWMPRFSAQLADILYDAELRGLQVKIITKEPSMIQYVASLKEQGIGKSLYFNLSADYAFELEPEMTNQNDGQSLNTTNPTRPRYKSKDGTWFWKRAMTVEEAAKYREKYPWVNVRIVATDLEEFIRGLKDPRVQVVTGYHGPKRDWVRVDSETGATKLNIEPLGDNGMPRFLYDGDTGTWTLDPEHPGKNKYHKRLAQAIIDNDLQTAYYAKACCITGRCAECQGKCGTAADNFWIKNLTNGDQESVAFWQEHAEQLGTDPGDLIEPTVPEYPPVSDMTRYAISEDDEQDDLDGLQSGMREQLREFEQHRNELTRRDYRGLVDSLQGIRDNLQTAAQGVQDIEGTEIWQQRENRATLRQRYDELRGRANQLMQEAEDSEAAYRVDDDPAHLQDAERRRQEAEQIRREIGELRQDYVPKPNVTGKRVTEVQRDIRETAQAIMEPFSILSGRGELNNQVREFLIGCIEQGSVDDAALDTMVDTLWSAGEMLLDPEDETSIRAAKMVPKKIYVSPQIVTEFPDPQSWRAFRNEMFGLGTILTTRRDGSMEVDSVWNEISREIPGVYSEETTDGRLQLEGMRDALRAAKPERVSLSEGIETTEGRSEEVYEYERDNVRKTVRAFLDRARGRRTSLRDLGRAIREKSVLADHAKAVKALQKAIQDGQTTLTKNREWLQQALKRAEELGSQNQSSQIQSAEQEGRIDRRTANDLVHRRTPEQIAQNEVPQSFEPEGAELFRDDYDDRGIRGDQGAAGAEQNRNGDDDRGVRWDELYETLGAMDGSDVEEKAELAGLRPKVPGERTTAEIMQERSEQLRDTVLRRISRGDFKPSESLQKLGVRVEGTVTQAYDRAGSLRDRSEAARQMQRATRRAERNLHATVREREFASGISAGIYTEADIPRTMNADKVMELAQYYMDERALGEDLIREQRNSINRDLDTLMQDVFQGADAHTQRRPRLLSLNYNTAQRNMRAVFGDEMGDRINREIFDPINRNESERIRFINGQFDKVRTFEGADGKQHRLTRTESGLVQMVIEGRAVGEQIASMEMGGMIQDAAESIRSGGDPADAAREFHLTDDEQELAEQYARWLQTQEALRSDKVDAVKIENAANAYAEIFDDYYDAINDFLVVHGYEPIGFIRGYAPHMQSEENVQTLTKVLQAFGIQQGVTELDTGIAGRTKDFRPNKRWNPYFQTRTGDSTIYDIEAAFESYVDYMSDVLYHTDDIMRLRRMGTWFRQTYGSQEIRHNIDHAQSLLNAPAEEKADFLRDVGVIDRNSVLSDAAVNRAMDDYIDKEFEKILKTTEFSNLVMWLDNYTNILAGKQNSFDRAMEEFIGRKTLNWGAKFTRAFSRAQVAGNVSTMLNQAAQLPMIYAEKGARNVARATLDIMTGKLRRGGFAQESDFLTGKRGIDFLVRTPGEMVTSALFAPAEFTDRMISTLAVRASYLQAVGRGMEHEEAMRAADQYGAEVMASRQKGARPTAFSQKNFIMQSINMFQIEAINSWEHVARDLPRDFREIEQTNGKNKAALALAGVIMKALLAAFVMNRIDEELYGGTPAPFDLMGLTANFVASGEGLTANDWIRTIIDNGWERVTGERIFGTDEFDPEREFDARTATEDLWYNISNEIPYVRNVSGLLGWGDQSLPLPDVYGGIEDIYNSVKDNGWISGETGEAAGNLLAQMLPVGRQASKTYQGARTMIKGGRMKGYGDNKRLQYPVEQSAGNWARALLFGNSGLPENSRFYAGDAEGLSKDQTALWQDMVDSGIDGGVMYSVLKDLSGKGKDSEKRAVIDQADLSEEDKMLIFSRVTRSDYYGKLIAQGVDEDEARMMAWDRAALQAPEGHDRILDDQVYEIITRSDYSYEAKLSGIKTVMDGDAYEKVVAVFDAGVPMEAWYDFRMYRALDGVKQAEITDYIAHMNISREAKDALWIYAGYKETTLKNTPWH